MVLPRTAMWSLKDVSERKGLDQEIRRPKLGE